MKKYLVVISVIIAVLFVLSGCIESNPNKVKAYANDPQRFEIVYEQVQGDNRMKIILDKETDEKYLLYIDYNGVGLTKLEKNGRLD